MVCKDTFAATGNLSDPDKYSDQAISKFMREVSGLKSSLRDLTKSYNAFLELTVTHRLEETLMDMIDLEMENTMNACYEENVNDILIAGHVMEKPCPDPR